MDRVKTLAKYLELMMAGRASIDADSDLANRYMDLCIFKLEGEARWQEACKAFELAYVDEMRGELHIPGDIRNIDEYNTWLDIQVERSPSPPEESTQAIIDRYCRG